MIGERVNNYEIVRAIGEGGMGTVYLARHPIIDRLAAVKVLHPQLAHKEALARFFNEARAANAIRHPNIIEIFDVGTLPSSGTPYMVMEYLEGESLAQKIRGGGPLPLEQALRFARQTASAVAAAHAKGIIHRDLKPDNLFLVPDQAAAGALAIKVLDFGIAKLRGDTSTDAVKTQTGMVMGTPPYMSPEQCRGVTSAIDHRTDVYALGVILYEMLAGQPPFVGEGFGDILVMHLTKPPPPLRPRNQQVPPSLEAAIMRALAKEPSERFQSMLELERALASSAPTTPGYAGTAHAMTVAAPSSSAPAPSASARGPSLRTAVPLTTTTMQQATGELATDGDLTLTPRPRWHGVALAAGAAVVAAGVVVAVMSRGASPSSPASSSAARPARAPVIAPPPPPPAEPPAPSASPAAPVSDPARTDQDKPAPRKPARASAKKNGAPTPLPPRPSAPVTKPPEHPDEPVKF